ncbi:MAG: VCBS repeat-containing protein [Polyangiaceae bacterium]
MRRFTTWALRGLFGSGLLTLIGCSCGDDTGIGATGAGGSGQGGSVGGAGQGGLGGGGVIGGAGTGGTGGGFIGCTGVVCGAGECCDGGQDCVAGACLTACDSGVRCGADLTTCCDVGDVCIAGACTPPGNTCLDWADCAEDEFCEPTIGKCLPQPAGAPLCEYKPPVGPLTPVLEWSWTESPIQPTFHQVINMPVVVDLEKDGTPDVVIVTSDNFSATGFAYLRALDGKTGAEKWDATNPVYLDANRVQPRATPAAGDIDGDGYPEIVTAKAGGGLIAFEHDGTVKWTSTQVDGVTPWTVGLESATVALADFEGDGTIEVVVGGAVFDAAGKLRFNQGPLVGANGSTYGAVSIVADLDGMGSQELVSGRRAYRADGSLYWDNGLVDGYPAIADLDGDSLPELVVVAAGTVRVQDPTTGAVRAQLTMPGQGAGGPPTIADFDADSVPEIAAANGSAYAVFEYVGGASPALSVKWSVGTQDLSSNRTGSSVFDFQGDGAAEVVYNDECYFRVYGGSDGAVLYEEANSSATIHEYPVVVDVDGDNNTEVVIAANDLNHLGGNPACPYGVGGARHGVYVYGDAADNWVRTRRVWNQHAYHITNVGSAAEIPSPEAPSWIVPPGLNNYRQSSQGAGVFNAPDLIVSLSADLAGCPSQVELAARVSNQGSLGVAPGVVVRFYRGTDATGMFLGQAVTTKSLLPGQYEDILLPFTVGPNDVDMSFFVTVDQDDMGNSALRECLEDNNGSALTGVSCPTPQ